MKCEFINQIDINNSASISFENLDKKSEYVLVFLGISSSSDFKKTDFVQISSSSNGLRINWNLFDCNPFYFTGANKIIVKDPRGNLKHGVIRLFKVNI